MRTRLSRLLVLSVLSVAIVAWPISGSAQVLEDACVADASLTPPPPGGHIVMAEASYTCSRSKPFITVWGYLLLDGIPVDSAVDNQFDSRSARVGLSFPCVPGVWSAVAVGAGAGRVLPAVDLAPPTLITQCDPLSP